MGHLCAIVLVMTSRLTPAVAEQPTPNPNSAVIANDRAGGSAIDPTAVTSIEELPRDLRDNPFVAYLVGMTPGREAYLAARSAAAEEGTEAVRRREQRRMARVARERHASALWGLRPVAALMLPTSPSFLLGLEFYFRRRRVQVRLDSRAIVDALAQAERLAAGNERDEPAALFFACSACSRAFFPEASNVVPHLARAHAAALGLDLRAADVALDIHQARILRGELDFAELRDWFAEHLMPISSPPR